MVDLSGGGHDGPLEHAFDNSVFIIPGIIVVSLTEKKKQNKMAEDPQQEGSFSGGISSAILQKINEQVENMDVKGMLQNLVSNAPGDEESEEIRSKLQGVLEKYNAMTGEEKFAFTRQLKDALASKLSMTLQGRMSGIEENIQDAIVNRLLIVGIGVFVLIAVVVFFGYKLYKSIKDKELKREEKKKLKQMKKKK